MTEAKEAVEKIPYKVIGELLRGFDENAIGYPEYTRDTKARHIINKLEELGYTKPDEKVREKIAHIVCGSAECFGSCPSYKGEEYPCQSKRPDQILSITGYTNELPLLSDEAILKIWWSQPKIKKEDLEFWVKKSDGYPLIKAILQAQRDLNLKDIRGVRVLSRQGRKL